MIFLLNDVNFFSKNAGFKARLDILDIIKKDDRVRILNSPVWGRVSDKIKLLPTFIFNLMRIPRGSKIIIQYPIPRPFINILILFSNVLKFKLIFLLHDVDVFRDERKNDLKYLNAADLLISHNIKMTDKLRMLGVSCKIIEIDIFDYLIDELDVDVGITDNDVNRDNTIVFCGNLSVDKSPFIYEWCTPNLKRLVYGVNQSENIKDNNSYIGSFNPSRPPLITSKSRIFGLVWDGDSATECAGPFGEYLLVNNPHKTSLYLSMGIPVIVWSQSAISNFINEKGLGLSVSSLFDIENILNSITLDDYNILMENVFEYSHRIKSGYFTRCVIDEIASYYQG